MTKGFDLWVYPNKTAKWLVKTKNVHPQKYGISMYFMCNLIHPHILVAEHPFHTLVAHPRFIHSDFNPNFDVTPQQFCDFGSWFMIII